MKKIFFYATTLLLVSTTLIGCAGEEDDIFSASAAERLNAASDKYSARLQAQPNGWAMQYYPTYADEYPYGSGYLILMDFDEDFSVKVAMDNSFCNNTYTEDRSPWQVITDNGPVLSFNAFNRCMHAFSDPEDIPWTEDNEQSEGCGGDYEFIIVDAPEDASYMMLKGKKRNTYNLLTPIEEGVDYQTYLADVKAFHNTVFPLNELVSNLMHFGDSIYRMDGSNDGLPNIYPDGSDAIANESFHPFLITKRGSDYYLRFRDAFERNDMEGSLQELRYDSIAQEFVGTKNDQWRITGYPLHQFFTDKITSGHTFKMARSAEMSEKMQGYISALAEGFDAIKIKVGKQMKSYELKGLGFGLNVETTKTERDSAYCWSIIYRAPNSSKDASSYYKYNVGLPQTTDNVLSTSYVSAHNESSMNQANAITAINDMLTVLNREFIISAADTKFNLSRVKFVAKDDPDLWFIMNY